MTPRDLSEFGATAGYTVFLKPPPPSSSPLSPTLFHPFSRFLQQAFSLRVVDPNLEQEEYAKFLEFG